MKRLISLILSIFILMSCTTVGASAVSINARKADLRAQFVAGEGPEIEGYSIDYRYYSPATEGDATKYPVVIWVHGHSHGQYEGYQIISNDIVNWSSDEYQARFGETGGAYIVAVRAPEDDGIVWDDELIKPLKAAIDDFIDNHRENIDATKIYIGGFSLGGMMTFKMAINYPDMFAAIFPICPYITISSSDAKKFSDVPVWLVSGKSDPLVSYNLRTKKNWNAVVNTTTVADDCRFSTLTRVCEPDGSLAPTAHYSWIAVTYDMFSDTNGDYPYMNTVSGAGKTVDLEYPAGMISWLTQFSSDYNPDTDEGVKDSGKTNINIINIITAPFTRVYVVLRNLMRPIFG